MHPQLILITGEKIEFFTRWNKMHLPDYNAHAILDVTTSSSLISADVAT